MDPTPPEPLSLTVLCDYAAEGWPSMDLCAEMLVATLTREHPQVEVRRVEPSFRRRASSLPGLRRARFAFNLDRLLNRSYDYPRHVQTLARRDGPRTCYHVADHSYAQLVHVLPPERTGVLVHDLDAFRCLIEPERDPRPAWFRRIARGVLEGLQRAGIVFHTTGAVRAEIERHGLVDPARLVAAPPGVAPEFAPETPRITAPLPPGVSLPAPGFLLHVGSCIPRKRIDVLLDLLAALRETRPELRLVKVGSAWSPAQREQIAALELGEAIDAHDGLPREALAELYRRAALVVIPSEAEGFGLPLVEALACGARVVASDVAALREVGGDAVTHAPVGDLAAWVAACGPLLDDPAAGPPRALRLEQAGRFSWSAHAAAIAAAYRACLP